MVLISEDLARGQAFHKIPVYNDVDDVGVRHYKYTNHMIPPNTDAGEDYYNRVIFFKLFFLLFKNGCKCVGKCVKGTCPCIDKSNAGHVKNVGEIYQKYDDKILFECDPLTCKGCGGKCSQRLTPEKFDKKVELYKTTYAGFAVRSAQFIPSGSYFCEFVGEYLSKDDVYNRKNVEEYSFNVDCHYIDPTRYGNISRFFNHSCWPNLTPLRFYSGNRKRNPSLGFIALYDICPGDQITIDYGQEWWQKNITENKEFYCQCDWVFCQYPFPGKPQLNKEDTKKLMKRIIRRKRKKLLKYRKVVEQENKNVVTTELTSTIS